MVGACDLDRAVEDLELLPRTQERTRKDRVHLQHLHMQMLATTNVI